MCVRDLRSQELCNPFSYVIAGQDEPAAYIVIYDASTQNEIKKWRHGLKPECTSGEKYSTYSKYV